MIKKLLLIAIIFSNNFLFAGTINKPVQSQYGFIENKGQIIDQNNQLNPSVLYLYNGNGLHVQLKQTGFSYEVIKTESKPKVKTRNEINIPSKFAQDSLDYTFLIHRIDISFVNANQNAKITSSEPASDYINYYTTGTSEAGVTNVHHYKKVLHQNIYPNIDVEFVLNENKFKYNFIIHPGGNVNDIQLKFDGAISTSLTKDGHITIETAYGNIDESVPYSYQLSSNNKEQSVHASFTSNLQSPTSNIYGISIGKYDATKTLIIDPVPWATYFGGTATDKGNSITNDGNGNILIIGSTNSASSIATSGAYQTILNGGSQDAFVAKFNNAGGLLWATYYGGSNSEDGKGIVNDVSGNVFFTGITQSSSGIASSGAYNTTYGGGGTIFGGDAFLVKLTSAGLRIWGTYFGGSSDDAAYAITIDASGNPLITGQTISTSGIATTGSYQTTFGGSSINGDAFITKFSSSGTLIWSTYYGSSSGDIGNGIAVDGSGNVVISGSTASTSGMSTSGSYQTTFGGNVWDAFIAKFNSSGTSLLWGTYYGGSGQENVHDLSIDGSGNILICGGTTSTTAITSTGCQQSTYGGGNFDGFIAVFNSSGIRQWGTYYGGSGDDEAMGIESDPSGNIIVTGYSMSSTGIATSGSYQNSLYNGKNAFIVKFNNSGTRQWGTYYGTSGGESGNGIIADGSGNIFDVGNYTDIFVLAITPGGVFLTIANNIISGNQSVCVGVVPSTITGSIPTGGNNSYTYLWQSSVVSSTSGFTAAAGTNNTINYTPPALTQNTWFKRIVISADVRDTSATVLKTINLFAGFNVNNSAQCFTGNSFIFNDTSLLSSGTATRKWNFGTSSSDTSILANPTKIYSATGTYQIKLIVTSSIGCKDSVTKTINVSNKPIVGFTINNNVQCQKLNSFSFVDTSSVSGGTLTRTWNFESGATDTSLSPSKYYSVAGTYNVKLVESNIGCKDSLTKVVIVNPSPIVAFNINNASQCLNGNSFSFTDISSISSGTYQRIWNFGNGDTSSIANPLKVYSNTGVYQVKLILTSNYGCYDTLIQTIAVNAKPNVGFTINNSSQCLTGNNFLFTDTSNISSGILTRQWNLGTGLADTISTMNASKQYVFSGSYNIKLIEMNGGCKDSITKTVTVNAKPNVGFTINNAIQCLNGNSFLFNDTSNISSGALTRQWDFGTGIADTSLLNNPNKVYTSANTYSVKLLSISNNGCKDSTTKTVIVNPKPVVGFTINNTSQCLNGNSFLFNDTSTISSGTITRNWDLGNGTKLTNISTSFSYANANTYSVKLVSSSNNGCKDSITKTVTVNPKPVVGFTINNPAQCLNGNNFLFNDSSTISSGTLNRNWDLGNGTNSTVINPSISYSTANTYQVKIVSISNNGCKDSLTKTITVNPKPNVGFTQNILSQCLSGNNFILNDTTTISSGTINRLWNFGDATNSSSTNPNKNYTNAGTYQIKLVATSNNNCKDSITKTVTVYTQPKSGFIINTLSQCLIGNNFSFNDTTTTSASRLWDLGDLTTNTNDTFSKSYSNAGTYNVKLKVNDAYNCSDSSIKVVTVKASPTKPVVSAITKSLLQSTLANSYQWYLNNTSITSATNQTLIITSNGSYTVKIDTTNGCSNLSNPFAASAVGIAGINNSDNEINIYPNPAKTELHIETTGTKKLTAQVFDMTGKEVSGNISFIKSVNFFTETLSEGMYFVRITDTNGAVVKMQKVAVTRE